MDYELRYINTNTFYLVQKCRKIKLRKQSFSNVVNKWTVFSNQQYMDVAQVAVNNYYNTPNSTDFDINTNGSIDSIPSEGKIIKIPVYIAGLENDINAIEESYNTFSSIKRRALALNKNMYYNIINNTNSIYGKTYTQNTNEIDEEEIKQAVKDAFDQISFNRPVPDETVISPEEVSNSVAESVERNEIDFNDSDLNFDINSIESTKDRNIDDNKAMFASFDDGNMVVKNNEKEEPIFKFGDINLSDINVAKENIKESSNSDYISNGDNKVTSDDSNDELEELLNSMETLKIEKEEQEKKTKDAHNLAVEKEKEKDKAKADFIEFQNRIKKDLDISKKQEKEELEKAKKAEKIANTLIDIMNNNSDGEGKFGIDSEQ